MSNVCVRVSVVLPSGDVCSWDGVHITLLLSSALSDCVCWISPWRDLSPSALHTSTLARGTFCCRHKSIQQQSTAEQLKSWYYCEYLYITFTLGRKMWGVIKLVILSLVVCYSGASLWHTKRMFDSIRHGCSWLRKSVACPCCLITFAHYTGHLGTAQQAINKTLTYLSFKVMINMLANSGLFTHPAAIEQYSFGVLLAILTSFSSVLTIQQLLRKISLCCAGEAV